VTKIIEHGEHGLNVEITHLNNINDKQIVSIRKLKVAKLRPSQIGDLPISLQEVKQEKKTETETKKEPEVKEEPKNKKEEESPIREVHNPKGRNVYTQARRKGQKKEIDTREEYEVQGILAEREGKKEIEYKVKWVGFPKPTWEPASFLENSKTIIENWNRKKKLNLAANKKQPPITKKKKK
jgi:Chromo (CHRromatin Organisation MOdifier) domain